MNASQETLKTWNKVAKVYERIFMDLNIYNASYNSFCIALPHPFPHVLEIGCGPGNISKYMLSTNPDIQFSGIDTSEEMIKLAKKNNPNAYFNVMNANTLHHIYSPFHGILCGFVLPYLSKEECLLLFKRSYALLEPNGVLYLSFVSGAYTQSGFQVNSQGDRMYFYYHEENEFIDELKSLQFHILHQFHIPYSKPDGPQEIHTVLICKKQ